MTGARNSGTLCAAALRGKSCQQQACALCISTLRQWLLALLVLVGMQASVYAQPALNGFKIVQQENLMLHFDLDTLDADVRMFTLTEPHRLVIDIQQLTLATDLPTENFAEGVIKAIRYAERTDGSLRVVLDLRHALTPSFSLVPRQGGQRIIVNMGVPADSMRPAGQARSKVYEEQRDVVIAIDAGHGGKDPGAIGRRKTQEKDVVLAVAIRLHNHLIDVPGITPVLIREDDVYIELRERMALARRAHADIFVSIHADAIDREGAHGSSVYALSLNGATSEAAAWLAKSENESAALHGDVALSGLDDGLVRTLINLTQGNTMERSLEVGADVLSELAAIGPVHKKAVEQAGFAVLKSPDIPSILIETAFISNLKEEEKLNSTSYQDKLAAGIAQGLYNYLMRRAPEGTYLAAQRQSR